MWHKELKDWLHHDNYDSQNIFYRKLKKKIIKKAQSHILIQKTYNIF